MIKLTNKFKKTIMGASIALVFALSAFKAEAASVDSAMNTMFNDMMVNATAPQTFQTINSMGIYGGRIVAKSKIFNEPIVTFQPPSIKAGCGGIDLFAGAFSFIDSEKFNQLLRSIGQNATGYIFQIAIKAIMPEVAALLSDIQKKIQALNEAMSNSCQLAQGIVNDTIDSMGIKLAQGVKTDASIKGTFKDMFAANDANNLYSKTKSDGKFDIVEKRIGNIVYKSLAVNNIRTLSPSGSTTSDTEQNVAELIMSVTGTIIILPPTGTESVDGETSDKSPTFTERQSLITLEDLMEPKGKTIKTYRCDTSDKCQNPTTVNTTVANGGFAKMITNILIGPTENGLIYKMSDKSNGNFTENEKILLSNMPGLSGVALKRLILSNTEAAKAFVMEVSQTIALDYAYNMSKTALINAKTSLNSSDSPYVEKVRKVLDDRLSSLADEHSILAAKYGKTSDVINKYETYLKMITLTNPDDFSGTVNIVNTGNSFK